MKHNYLLLTIGIFGFLNAQSQTDSIKTTLDEFGIAESSALDMAAMFGDMSTSMGLSTQKAAELSTSMVGLAGDLASFKNIGINRITFTVDIFW